MASGARAVVVVGRGSRELGQRILAVAAHDGPAAGEVGAPCLQRPRDVGQLRRLASLDLRQQSGADRSQCRLGARR